MRMFIPLILIISSVGVGGAGHAASTQRVSVSSEGLEASSSSTNPVLSGDGNIVAFESSASNLVSGDSNSAADIFVRDLGLGTTTRVSVNSAGEQANAMSAYPALSRDGRFVVFESNASNLVAGDTNNEMDVFLHDRLSGATERISQTIEFGEAVYDSHAPAISADGRFVVYHSYADNLVPGDTNQSEDIFLYDRQQGLTQRISVNGSIEANAGSYFPQISADGRYVTFYSYADNLIANDANGRVDVFLFDSATGALELISVNSNGEQADNHSFLSSVSNDGRFVAFESSASNLEGSDTNLRSDIFLRDRLTQTTVRVSRRTDGTESMGTSRSPKVSADGSYVAFSSLADLLVGVDLNLREDIYLYTLASGRFELVSVDSAGAQGNFNSTLPSVSDDGLRVAFRSASTNLVTGDLNNQMDTFLRTRNRPPVAVAGEDRNIYLGAQALLDGSASFDPDGDALSYSWRIELSPQNSTATLVSADSVNAALQPDMLGDYVVSLVVSDGMLSSIADEVFIRVNENLPPVAAISAAPLTGFAPLTVQFDASGSSDPENGPLSYAWDFGIQGATSTLTSPAYTYSVAGTYTVVLTLRDDFGNTAENLLEIVVMAGNTPPVLAPYTASAAQGPAPLQVDFVANASDEDGDTLSYYWDFGDGFNSREENPTHTYYQPGAYTVTVEVSDGAHSTTAQLFVAVESTLSIEGLEAEMDWEGRHAGKLKLEVELNGMMGLSAGDKVRVVMGELLLLEVPFGEFERKETGVYLYKDHQVYAKLDFRNQTLKISKRLKSSAVKIGQAVQVTVVLGEAMATEQVLLTPDEHHRYDKKHDRKHAKFCKRKARR